jgi:hypothetical protein
MSLPIDVNTEAEPSTNRNENQTRILEEHLFLDNKNHLDSTDNNPGINVNQFSTIADKLKALVNVKKLYRQYRNSFDANNQETFKKIIFLTPLPVFLGLAASSLPYLSTFIIDAGFLGSVALGCLFYFRHKIYQNQDDKFLYKLKKGKQLQDSIAYHKELLLPVISEKEFQFELLYCLKLLAQKLGNTNTTKFNGDWVMQQYETLKNDFYHEDYVKACDTLALLHLHYHEMSDVRAKKEHRDNYEKELEAFIFEKEQQCDRADLSMKQIESRLKDML